MSITLATLPEATAQEVFDHVALHLLTQMQVSMRTRNLDNPEMGEVCAYRGDNGLKCAAGALISDDEYNELMEGKSWLDLVAENVAPDDHWAFITALQKIHDTYDPPLWHEKLSALARAYNLTPPADRTCTS